MDEWKTFKSSSRWFSLCTLLWLGLVCAHEHGFAQEPVSTYGLGRPATESEIREWDRDVTPNGEGLPRGEGSVQQGAQVYATKCASCHGATGSEGPVYPLVGGRGTFATKHPVKTVGSFWPYATTLYDYILRAMPPTAPQSLTANEVYALVAWILYRNDIVDNSTVLNAESLPTIQMPNRNGFVPDPRPDIKRK